MKCTRCLEIYWVCEVHDALPWDGRESLRVRCGRHGVRRAILPILTIRMGHSSCTVPVRMPCPLAIPLNGTSW